MTLTYPVDSNKAHPLPLSPGYKSSLKRAPQKPLIPMRHTLGELTGPVYGHETVREHDSDLTRQHSGEPLGERILVHGHVLDEDGRGGAEYAAGDLAGQCLRPLHPRSPTSIRRRSIRISPAPGGRNRMPPATTNSSPSSRVPIPGAITTTPGAPRISISRCSATLLSRGSSLRCIFRATRCSSSIRSSMQCPDANARMRMVSSFDLVEYAAGMGAVLSLQHRAARSQKTTTLQEEQEVTGITPSQTVGPFFKYGLTPNRQYAWNDAFTRQSGDA